MEETPFAPRDAANELRALASFDGTLRQRMEGVLWMVAGLVFSCLFLSYSFGIVSDLPVATLAVLWIPWVGAGALVLWALRRGLSLPEHEIGTKGATWTFAGFAVASLLGIAGLVAVGSESSAAIALIAFSAVALVPSFAPKLGFTALGRRVGLALAALGILSGIVALLVGQGEAGAWAGSSVGLLWVAGGAYQVLQG